MQAEIWEQMHDRVRIELKSRTDLARKLRELRAEGRAMRKTKPSGSIYLPTGYFQRTTPGSLQCSKALVLKSGIPSKLQEAEADRQRWEAAINSRIPKYIKI